ncbi:hypothetical protein GIV96_24635 [Pseudomonas syringae]|nr:hypothetical protein [Pseudomonas syringae]MCF5316288.1 hypothetical protein [Pseudomonas syringae]MCF5364058.1 hypothetical protein [Pseudomonas syringae]MCF5392521.1 hypothetical protein [Pseudomonas syringae]MCF5396006.1 hypothetical protein [Pseudomonas syringae]
MKKKCAGPCSARTDLRKKRYSLLNRLRRLGRRHLNLYRSYKDCLGEIKVSIALGGMVIEPGDLVIGDDDDLPCVPFDQAEGASILVYIRIYPADYNL